MLSVLHSHRLPLEAYLDQVIAECRGDAGKDRDLSTLACAAAFSSSELVRRVLGDVGENLPDSFFDDAHQVLLSYLCSMLLHRLMLESHREALQRAWEAPLGDEEPGHE